MARRLNSSHSSRPIPSSGTEKGGSWRHRSRVDIVFPIEVPFFQARATSQPGRPRTLAPGDRSLPLPFGDQGCVAGMRTPSRRVCLWPLPGPNVPARPKLNIRSRPSDPATNRVLKRDSSSSVVRRRLRGRCLPCRRSWVRIPSAASVVGSPERPRRGRGAAATIRARRLVTFIAFVAAVLGSVILAAIAQAAPGDLDPTFSADGEQTTDFGGSSEAKAVVVQPDGKVVVVGATFGTSPSPLPATSPTALSTRASPATAGRRPTSGWRTRWRFRRTARLSWSAASTPASPSPATTRTVRSIRASPATASRRLASGGLAKTRRPE